MSTVCEFPYSDLSHRPAAVAAAADDHRRVILRRRNAPDLALTRADAQEADLAEAGAFASLLAQMLPYVPESSVPTVISNALPWTRYLTARGQATFLEELPLVLRASVEMQTLAPLGTFLAEWRDTAAIQADPVLRERLTRDVEVPLDRPVPAP